MPDESTSAPEGIGSRRCNRTLRRVMHLRNASETARINKTVNSKPRPLIIRGLLTSGNNGRDRTSLARALSNLPFGGDMPSGACGDSASADAACSATYLCTAVTYSWFAVASSVPFAREIENSRKRTRIDLHAPDLRAFLAAATSPGSEGGLRFTFA